jgi:nucleoside-diphosphate-sugar epimerase
MLFDSALGMVAWDSPLPFAIEKTSQGIDVVITTANSAQRGGDDNTQTVDLDDNRNLIDAAREAQARQFVFVGER